MTTLRKKEKEIEKINLINHGVSEYEFISIKLEDYRTLIDKINELIEELNNLKLKKS